MPEYLIAGSDCGVALVDVADLMDEFGDEATSQAIRDAQGMPVAMLCDDPLRLLRIPEDGDLDQTFDYFLNLLNHTTVDEWKRRKYDEEEAPPDFIQSRREQIEGDADEERPDDDERPPPGVATIVDPGSNNLTLEQAAELMVEAHRDGRQSFFAVDVEFTVKVALQVQMMAKSRQAAEDVVSRIRSTDPEELAQSLNVDPAEVMGRAITALSHSSTLEEAGWSVRAAGVEKLSDDQMRRLAIALIKAKILSFEAEASVHASVLRNMMQGKK